MSGRPLFVLMFLLAICSPSGDFAHAQEPEDTSETEDSNKANDQEEQEPDEFEEALREFEAGLAETVKVTATRVETDLMKTPVAVTVIDQDTLDREGVRSVEGIAQMVPNMDIATKNGQSTPMISMRGIRSTNETELGDPSVGVHLDGIYSPRMQGILGLMFDNERVEVARGPQGTLFGRNSTVGSINIVSAKPKLDAYDMSVNLSYGNYNAPELQGMVNLPVTESFALRFAGRYHQRDSYIDGYWDPNQWDQRYIGNIVQDAPVIGTGQDCSDPSCYTRTQHSNWWADDEVAWWSENPNDEFEIRALVPADDDDFYLDAKEWAYRFSGLWQPEDKNMSFNFSVQHFRSDGSGGIDLVNCDKLRGRPNYCRDANLNGACDSEEVGDVEEFNIENYIINAANPVADCNDLFPRDDTYQAVVNVPGELSLDIKYLRTQFNWDLKEDVRLVVNAGFEDQDRESAQDMEQSLNAWDQAMYFLPGTGSESWMTEVQLQSYSDKKFNWIAGVNYFHEKTSTIGYFDNPIQNKDLWIQPDRSTNAYAAFAQGTYSFSPEWHLTLGYRFSDETKQDKDGKTWNCDVNNSFLCAPDIGRRSINGGLNSMFRDDVNAAPLDYFESPDVYSKDFVNDTKDSWSHHDWRIGVDYDRNEDMLLYAYLATGFKAGGIGDNINRDLYAPSDDPDNPFELVGTEVIGTAYEPEEVTTLELGLKQWFLDRKLNLRGAYFFSDYKDMQYAAVGTLGFTQRIGQLIDPDTNLPTGEIGIVEAPIIAYFTDNVPGAEIQGFELEYDWRAWQGGRIHGYASWLDTEITDDWAVDWGYDPVNYLGLLWEEVFQTPDQNQDRLQVNLKGNDLAVSPTYKLHFTVDHAFLLENMRSTIVPWVTVHWEDDSYLTIWNVDKHSSSQPCPEQPPGALPDGCMDFVIRPEDIQFTDDRRDAWSMLHAGLRLYSGNWLAELYAYNLTDETVQWWGGAAEGVAKGSFSMPRNYGIRMGYQAHF